MSETVSVPTSQNITLSCQKRTSVWTWVFAIGFLAMLLICGLLLMVIPTLAFSAQPDLQATVIEQHESGDVGASQKVAIIDIVGTISPPLTDRVIEHAEHARDDDDVKAVLLRIDSPGGLVADSHQIFHRLKELAEKKPVYASFGRLAASGGYYVAMGIGPDGKIFTEPTTWTGSIGVIVPHYEVVEMANNWGFEAKPLTTGPFKDTLSPFKTMSDDEKSLWEEIITEAFDRFVGVIEHGRSNLSEADIRDAATGQIFTSTQALTRGLVDAEGYEDDAVKTLIADLGLGDPNVVRYATPPSFLDVLTGSVKTHAQSQVDTKEALLKHFNSVMAPQPLYLFGWPNVSF